MRKLCCFAIALIVLLSCDQKATSGSKSTAKPLLPVLTLPDAVSILGEPAHITDSSWTTEKEIIIYQNAYTANTPDPKGGKTGVFYFFIEQHPTATSAAKTYSDIKTANENHGIKVLNGLGDEAYFHTDNENFYYIMVRKGNTGFRIKVNKITSTTSLDAFNRVAKEIVEKL
jgi:hypothetical protein